MTQWHVDISEPLLAANVQLVFYCAEPQPGNHDVTGGDIFLLAHKDGVGVRGEILRLTADGNSAIIKMEQGDLWEIRRSTPSHTVSPTTEVKSAWFAVKRVRAQDN